MRGLGWLYADYGADGIREVLNDRRLIENLRCNVPAGIDAFVAPGDLCFVYGQRWLGCGGAYTNVGHTEAIDFANDPAPWAGLYGAGDFLGYWVDRWEGFPVEYDRSVNQRGWSFGGANFTQLRPRHLSMTFEVVMVATNENALNTGLEYLRECLRGPDGCTGYEVVVFDDCDPNGDIESYWRLRDVGVLEMPRWMDEPVPELGCVFRRCLFVLGAQDPYRYRCPEECLAETELEAPEPAVGDCYTWEEWFCNDDLDPVCCELTTPDVATGVYASVITIRSGPVGAPPLWINDGGDSTWLTKPLAVGEMLVIDNARRSLRHTDDAGVETDGAPYIVTDGGVPDFPVITRWSDSLEFCVRPYRICQMDGASIQIDRVLPGGLMLGCSDYSAWLATRGGRDLVMQLPWTSLRWNRLVDDISAATVELLGVEGRCCGEYAAATPWEHEVVIFRNDELAWSGPLVHKTYDTDGIHLEARDVMVWTQRRRIHNDLVHIGVDLSAIFNAYVRDAMAVDNSPRLTVEATPCGIGGERRVLAAQRQIAWNLIDELCQTGVDFTVIGRNVIVGGFEIEVEPIGTLLDSHIAEIGTLEVDGESLTSETSVLGDGYGEAGATIVGVYPDAPDATLRDLYGLHEVVFSEPDAKDAASARARARTNYELNRRPKLILGGATLEADAPFPLVDLIPGRVIRTLLAEQCETIGESYRITRVDGSAGPEHDTISLDFAPVGSAGVFA